MVTQNGEHAIIDFQKLSLTSVCVCVERERGGSVLFKMCTYKAGEMSWQVSAHAVVA